MTDSREPGPVLVLCKTDCRPWAMGGMELLVARQTRWLMERGVRARLVLPAVGITDALVRRLRSEGVSIEASPELRASGWLRPADMLALWRLVRRSDAKAVIVHSGTANLPLLDILAVRAAGVGRCIASPHLNEPISNPVLAAATRVAGRLCDAVVVTTEAQCDQLLRAGVPRRVLRMIPTGIPAPADPPSRAEARQRLGIPSDAFVVGAVGRLVAIKGFDILIQALGQIPDPDGRTCLVVAGSGPRRAALESAAGERLAGRARFLGFVDDPTPVYAAADLLAVPSFAEGIPLVLKEAAHVGVPCVVSDLPGISSAVVNGETGLLVPAGDVAALADAIRRLRDDPPQRERLGRAARAFVAEAFDEVVMADRMVDLLAPGWRARPPAQAGSP